jgi:hypothetical protein
MICLRSNTVSLFDKVEPIVRWEVWFVTEAGMFATLDGAKATAPDFSIIPIPVAIGATIYEPSLKIGVTSGQS